MFYSLQTATTKSKSKDDKRRSSLSDDEDNYDRKKG